MENISSKKIIIFIVVFYVLLFYVGGVLTAYKKDNSYKVDVEQSI